MNSIVVVDLHSHRVIIILDEGEVLQSYTRAVDAEAERLKLS